MDNLGDSAQPCLGHVCGIGGGPSSKIIACKVRRLLHDEIKRMERFVTFEGARSVGRLLNLRGLELTAECESCRKDFSSLQLIVVDWAEANFRRLLIDHPKVAEACLQGSVTDDAVGKRLVKTNSDETGKEPDRDCSSLDSGGFDLLCRGRANSTFNKATHPPRALLTFSSTSFRSRPKRLRRVSINLRVDGRSGRGASGRLAPLRSTRRGPIRSAFLPQLTPERALCKRSPKPRPRPIEPARRRR